MLLLPSTVDEMMTPPTSPQHSNKPMIIDVSVDDRGKQIYKVRSGRTRVLNRKRSLEDESDNSAERPKIQKLSPETLQDNEHQAASDDNIWSTDVEEAFKEALRMIPKNGLTKIKVSGKSCGRNELISDYIAQKTGKTRTRKQVSSHIQVIKNLRKNHELIELINNGPTDPESLAMFDKVFGDISFKKSLGTTSLDINKPSTPISKKKISSRKSSPVIQEKVIKSFSNYKDASFNLKSFQMFNPNTSHIFTKFSFSRIENPLRLKPNACIQNRFPNLNDFLNDTQNEDEQIPLLHNLVNMNLPNGSKWDSGNHQSNLEIEIDDIQDEQYGCISMIYSFGNEIIKLNEEVEIVQQDHKNHKKLLKLKFAKDFWVTFFDSVSNQNKNDVQENQKAIAVKAITIKQVIYNKRKNSGFEQSDTRGIILWEFTKNSQIFDTSSRRIYLPNNKKNKLELIAKYCEPVEFSSPKKSDRFESQDLVSDSETTIMITEDSSEPQIKNEIPYPKLQTINSYQSPLETKQRRTTVDQMSWNQPNVSPVDIMGRPSLAGSEIQVFNSSYPYNSNAHPDSYMTNSGFIQFDHYPLKITHEFQGSEYW